MKETLINNPITDLYNNLFNIKDKMTSGEWLEINKLLMDIHKMKTLIKWKTEHCNCCDTSESEIDSSDSEYDN